MKYFFDENFSPRMVNALSGLHERDWRGDSFESIHSREWRATKDEPWIQALKNTQDVWTIVTMDQMRRERNAVQGSGFTWCIFAGRWANLDYWEQAWKLVKVWPDVVRESERNRGRVFTVTLNGKITRQVEG